MTTYYVEIHNGDPNRVDHVSGRLLPEEAEFKTRKAVLEFLKTRRLPRKDQIILITDRDRMSFLLVCQKR